MTITQPTTFDTTALVRAIEARDADAVVALYAGDAVLSIVDRDHPPSTPRTLTGASEIDHYYRELCGRNIEHRVSGLVSDGETVAFQQDCRYPEGGRVVCLTVARLRDGRIHSQTLVQAWDD